MVANVQKKDQSHSGPPSPAPHGTFGTKLFLVVCRFTGCALSGLAPHKMSLGSDRDDSRFCQGPLFALFRTFTAYEQLL